ncbi:PhzF family phenazine biosynthesis protein [Oscillatoria sp. FACHB-1407]|uniref:PhzF family phenazine biosynthesis protein n=1 Tax=Oscillatoria sp. FACHB-1407 TaxID=2692847 RepID=UPI00168A2159|nr:PhzF family phenazine biosynthesis protein [Oscillatoria sp. FACHB-1407]MBD2459954.1 PhzF family phenazine biosynthesis protein [Oscillatoria sp. FACHB-1407]
MPTYPFIQVDAFTTRPLGGNPCAVVFEADSLSQDMMQAIAREQNLSETAFVLKSAIADVRARYFTPSEEIPLAGHPTIATIFALIDSGRIQLTQSVTPISLELQVGVIPIEVFARDGKVERIVMTQKQPQFLATYSPEEVMPAFGLTAEDTLPNAPIQTVSTGTPQLMIPVRDLMVLQRAVLNIPLYNDLRAKGDFFSPHLFCTTGVTEAGQTFARQFGSPPDRIEDPFTGSATGGMAAFLWRYGLIAEPCFVAEQGHWMERPGQGFVEVVGPRDQIETVKVGGSAVAVLKGELIL